MKTNSIFLRGLLAIAVASAVFISCKDDFTEEDLLNKQGQDSVQLTIVVVNASTSSILKSGKPSSSRTDGGERSSAIKGLADLTVTLINAKGTTLVKTTDANGLVSFRGLEPGTVAGVVSGTGFTTTNFVVSIRNTRETNDPFTSAGVMIPVFEKSGPNTAKVTGTVTAELNLLNNTRETVPDGTKIGFTIFQPQLSSDETAAALLSVLIGDVSSIPLENAKVTSLSFEGGFVASTTGGTFSIELPTSPEGLTYEVEFSDFTAAQSIAINNFDNEVFESIRDVQSLTTLFSQSSSYQFNTGDYRIAIPSISAVQLDIAAPPAAGTGAAITAALEPQAVDAGFSFTVLAKGSGYAASSTTIPVTVVGGSFDATVPGSAAANLTATSDANGQITGITGTLGFGYRSQATLIIGGSGTGAVVRVNYASTVASPFGVGVTSGTVITSGGTGYVIAPNVLFRGFNSTGGAIEGFATGVIVNGGALINFTSPGTLFARLSGPAVVQSASRTTATATLASVDNNGVIDGLSITNLGAGYDPATPPAVTVRDLRAIGSGAQIFASTNTSGQVDALLVIQGGSGYSGFQANYPNFAESFSFATENFGGYLEDTNTIIVMRPGVSRTINAHYGTGRRSRAVN